MNLISKLKSMKAMFTKKNMESIEPVPEKPRLIKSFERRQGDCTNVVVETDPDGTGHVWTTHYRSPSNLFNRKYTLVDEDDE